MSAVLQSFLAFYVFIGIGMAIELLIPILLGDKKLKQLTKIAILMLILFLPMMVMVYAILGIVVAILCLIEKIKMFK